MTPPHPKNMLPHQRAFFERFLAPDAAERQLLIAPVGMGKGFAAERIVHAVASRTGRGRVLILAPAALATSFVSSLEELQPSYPVRLVDRQRLRERLSRADGRDVFEPRSVTVMSIDFAKRDDVAAVLQDVEWSLVVVDEAHSLGRAREHLIQCLSQTTNRLLLLASIEAASAITVPELDVVRWTRDARDERGRPLFVAVPRQQSVVEYARSDQEALTTTALTELVDDQGMSADTPSVDLVRRMMKNAVASSPSAIEQILLRQIDALASPTPSLLRREWADRTEAPEDDEPAALAPSSMWRDSQAALARITKLIAALDALQMDSKASALINLMRRLRSEKENGVIWVFSMFASTIAYLAEVLAEYENVWVLIGSMSYGERLNSIQDASRSNGGVVVSSAAARGLPFLDAHIAIHYDLPEGVAQMEQRWAVMDRVGQHETVRAFAFRDTKQTLEWEELLLRRHGFIL